MRGAFRGNGSGGVDVVEVVLARSLVVVVVGVEGGDLEEDLGNGGEEGGHFGVGGRGCEEVVRRRRRKALLD